VEFEKYLRELVKEKRETITSRDNEEQVDILSNFVKGASATPGSIGTHKLTLPDTLTESEIMADTFMFLFGGHESTASTLYFSMLFLALNPHAQQNFQTSLDDLFSNRPQEEWDYDRDFPKLSTSMAAAVMNETLRLMPPFMYIPKVRPEGKGAQAILLNGEKMLVPDGCHMSIVLPAVHRNPNFWPTEKEIEDDLDQFRPERWFVKDGGSAAKAESPPDTAPEFYRPPRGAFLPFSDGPRSCIGRRFAQIEILAFLSTVFFAHSVELSVSNLVTDVELERMPLSGAERRAVWEKAAVRVRQRMGLGIEEIGLGLCTRNNSRAIEFRLVKRGEERFRGF
jgi:cytochrome P450